jgi:hypothetical protein
MFVTKEQLGKQWQRMADLVALIFRNMPSGFLIILDMQQEN